MDPHAPPPALVQFADELAQRLQGALDAPELAIRLFSELSQCVLAKEGRADSPPVQIQALCLATARILARDEPGIFEARLRVLESRSNSQALRLQDAFEALQR